MEIGHVAWRVMCGHLEWNDGARVRWVGADSRRSLYHEEESEIGDSVARNPRWIRHRSMWAGCTRAQGYMSHRLLAANAATTRCSWTRGHVKLPAGSWILRRQPPRHNHTVSAPAQPGRWILYGKGFPLERARYFKWFYLLIYIYKLKSNIFFWQFQPVIKIWLGFLIIQIGFIMVLGWLQFYTSFQMVAHQFNKKMCQAISVILHPIRAQLIGRFGPIPSFDELIWS